MVCHQYQNISRTNDDLSSKLDFLEDISVWFDEEKVSWKCCLSGLMVLISIVLHDSRKANLPTTNKQSGIHSEW